MNLRVNLIRDGGAEHLAGALRVNQVRGPLLSVSRYPTVTSITDTDNNAPGIQRDRYCRCGASGWSIASESGETASSHRLQSCQGDEYYRH